MYRKSSNLGDAVIGLVFYLGISAWVADSLHINVLLALLIVAGGTYALLFTIFKVADLFRWAKKRKPCARDVREDLGTVCERCKLGEHQREQYNAALLAERERVDTIKRDAKALREREIERLSTLWLTDAETYFAMQPRQFENAIAQLFRTLGYTVKQTPYSNDGGKDAILSKDGKRFLLECKRYSQTNCIGRPDMMKFVAAMHDEGAVGGFFVNTGRYSPGAKKYADQHSVIAYDRHTFASLVLQAYPVKIESTMADTMCPECGAVVRLEVREVQTTAPCPNGHAVLNSVTRADLRVFTPNGDVPYCEKCGSAMRIVRGRRGAFWGCSRYPRCRYTRNVQTGTVVIS